ncbi:hypothetical protein FG386_002988 [Cryptosporidium ryanae]|uniref:uncharacterized protein n=1 Tax=Cryptosporidium ryanae TaxID=515981 RepID=UPI00351A8ED2|nr:hypothetical protein FG386_002988 [Cryptosporidium ryanae]
MPKKRKKINFLKIFMVDGSLNKLEKSEDFDVNERLEDEVDEEAEKQKSGANLENEVVNGDGIEEDNFFDILSSKSDSFSSESGLEECINVGKFWLNVKGICEYNYTAVEVRVKGRCNAKEIIKKRNSDLFILNTISSSKSKTGNVLGKAAWEALNKSGTRWVIKSFVKFGRSSFISKSMLNGLGTYLFDSIWWFETDLPLVALTIDDVPGLDPETNKEILDLLNYYNIKCTFFVTERNARYIKDADLFLKRCVDEGHELGNHLAKDVPAHKLSISTFTKHLLECEHLITKYSPEHIFTNTRIFPPMFSSHFRKNNNNNTDLMTKETSLSTTVTAASSSSPFPSFCLENESVGINWRVKSLENEKQEKNERDENNKLFGHKDFNDIDFRRNDNHEDNLDERKYQQNENSYFGKIIRECTNTIETFINRERSGDNINNAIKLKEEKEVSDIKFKWFRPPFGRLTKQQYDLVVSRGYTVVMCDVYPNDVSFQGFPQFLAQFCTSNAAPGSIVCLHIPSSKFRSANIEVLRLMLPEISRKYKCVTLSELAKQIHRSQYSRDEETNNANLEIFPNFNGRSNSGDNSYATIKSNEGSPEAT